MFLKLVFQLSVAGTEILYSAIWIKVATDPEGALWGEGSSLQTVVMAVSVLPSFQPRALPVTP